MPELAQQCTACAAVRSITTRETCQGFSVETKIAPRNSVLVLIAKIC